MCLVAENTSIQKGAAELAAPFWMFVMFMMFERFQLNYCL